MKMDPLRVASARGALTPCSGRGKRVQERNSENRTRKTRVWPFPFSREGYVEAAFSHFDGVRPTRDATRRGSIFLFCLCLTLLPGCLVFGDNVIQCGEDSDCPSGWQCAVNPATSQGGAGKCEPANPTFSFVSADAGAFDANGPFVPNATVFSAVDGFNRINVQLTSSKQLDGQPNDALAVSLQPGNEAFTCGAYQGTSPNYRCSYTVTGMEAQGPGTILAGAYENGVDAGMMSLPVVLDFTQPQITSLSANATVFSTEVPSNASSMLKISVGASHFAGVTASATATIVSDVTDMQIKSLSCDASNNSANFTCSYLVTGTEPLGAAHANIEVVDQVGNASSAQQLSLAFAKSPAAPTQVTAALDGSGAAKVSWSAPNDSGTPITQYTVTATPGGLTATAPGSATSAVVMGLTNGSSYTFTVTATNAVNESVPSESSPPLTVGTVPNPPTQVTATRGNAQATVSWTAPGQTGGLPIQSYTVVSSPGNLSATVAAPLTTATVTHLTNGVSYTFTVTAANPAGSSAPSSPSPAVSPTSSTPPGAPTNVSATPATGSAIVSWAAPSNGGDVILSYQVTTNPGGHVTTVASPVPLPTMATITGLTNGTSYTFTVTATNDIGTGPASNATSAVTPFTVPGAPTSLSATQSGTQATVTWAAPASDGWSTITGYTVTSNPATTVVPVTAPATTATISGLTAGTPYTFSVLATNAAGNGPSATTAATIPLAPTGATATAGPASALVNWTPLSTGGSGGSPVLSYTVTASPGGQAVTVQAPASSATVTGLTNGTSYTFTISAANAVGSSASSQPTNAVVPTSVPDPPTNVSATAGIGVIAVTWVAPSNEGRPITGYTVTCSPGNQVATATASATAATVTGLANGGIYTCTVVATNANGNSLPSIPTTAVMLPTVPDAPVGVYATTSVAGAMVSWTAPVNNGGLPITSYSVTVNPGATIMMTTGSPAPTTLAITGLSIGVQYTFTVAATNAVGTGAASLPAGPFALPNPPGVPTNVSATVSSVTVTQGTATISWTAPASDIQIGSYTVTSSPGGLSTTVSGSPPATTASVSGLTNGTAYTFTVTATSAAGTSAPSAPSAAITPLSFPGAPTGVAAVASATPSGGQAIVTWTAPPDGGSPITGYQVTSSPGGLTASVTGSPPSTTATVSGLVDGTSYTFTVTATNSVGTGVVSIPSVSVTPLSVPGAPTNVVATAGTGQATVTWTAPPTGGSAITRYTVTASPSGAMVTTTGATSAVMTGLSEGTTYTFTVFATNAQGNSVVSSPSSPVTIPGPPGTPTGVAATAGSQEAFVSWTAPSNGGSAITGYTVTVVQTGATVSVTAAAGTTATVTGLTAGSSYSFTVTATNALGNSAASAASSSVTILGAPSSVALTASPTSAVANSASITLMATVKDSNGNPLPGLSVSFTSSPTGATFSPATPTTSASGVATATFNDAIARSYTVTAKAGTVTASTSVTLTNSCATSVSFTSSTINLPTSAQGLAAADFNNDGAMDLAVAGTGNGTVIVLLNNRSGGFSVSSTTSVGSGPQGITIGDFNGDGKPDIAVSDPAIFDVVILLGNGSGGFTRTGTAYGLGGTLPALIAGVFTGTTTDLAVANVTSNAVDVLIGSGSGGFSLASGSPPSTGTTPSGFVTGDFNGDQKLDLAVANAASTGGNSVSILLNAGSGAFSGATGSPVSVGTAPVALAAGLFNADSNLDLAVANSGSGNITILTGQGNGQFTTGSTITVGTTPMAIATGDYNSDGTLDLAVANQGSGNVSFLIGNGTGSFTVDGTSAVGNGPAAMVAADFTGDGTTDVVTVNTGDDSLTLLSNQCP